MGMHWKNLIVTAIIMDSGERQMCLVEATRVYKVEKALKELIDLR